MPGGTRTPLAAVRSQVRTVLFTFSKRRMRERDLHDVGVRLRAVVVELAEAVGELRACGQIGGCVVGVFVVTSLPFMRVGGDKGQITPCDSASRSPLHAKAGVLHFVLCAPTQVDLIAGQHGGGVSSAYDSYLFTFSPSHLFTTPTFSPFHDPLLPFPLQTTRPSIRTALSKKNKS